MESRLVDRVWFALWGAVLVLYATRAPLFALLWVAVIALSSAAELTCRVDKGRWTRVGGLMGSLVFRVSFPLAAVVAGYLHWMTGIP